MPGLGFSEPASLVVKILLISSLCSWQIYIYLFLSQFLLWINQGFSLHGFASLTDLEQRFFLSSAFPELCLSPWISILGQKSLGSAPNPRSFSLLNSKEAMLLQPPGCAIPWIQLWGLQILGEFLLESQHGMLTPGWL